MKRLRESVMAKFIAWLLCIASVLGTIVLGLCMAAGLSDDLFGRTREEALKELYQYVNRSYAEDAYRNKDNSAYAEMLRDNYFKYGIIQSDGLKGIDLNDIRSYLDTNMTEEELADINVDQFFLNRVGENSYGSLSCRTMGYYGDYEDVSVLDRLVSDWDSGSAWSYHYADRICYDVAKGIVYYRADGNYYPVQNVSLCYNGSEGPTVYNYSYSFDDQGYRLNYKNAGAKTEWADEYTHEPVPVEEPDELQYAAENQEQIEETAQSSVTDQIENILGGSGNGSIVNLAELNDTAFGSSNWGAILLDDIRSIRGDELTLINSDTIADSLFIEEGDYYLNEDYTLVVREDIQQEMYWVVSIVPDYVPADRVNSEYNQKGWLVNFYYDIADRNLFQGFGISVFVMVLSLGFLIYAAGHRRAVDTIVFTPLDRIPIEVLSIVAGAAEFVFLFLWIFVMEETGIDKSAYACLEVCGMFGIVMTAIAVLYVLSLSVRVKAGKWWRNSVCYRIYSWIHDILASVFRNIGLLWKIIIVIALIAFVEIAGTVIFDTDTDVRVMLLLLEKLVLCIILCVLALQIRELQKAGQCMADGNLSYKVNTAKMFWECRKHGENLNKISEGMSKAVNERMKSERLKTELITNVSHDIKTPLTSIINYVDLFSKEELHNEKAAEYLEVLDRQSSKLKKLIEDLVEASKASSGNLAVDIQQLEAGVFVTQTVGEFEEKLSLAGLELIVSKPEEPVYIMADGRHIWRVIDNLMNNICKYAQTGSRVYVNLEATEESVRIIFRNISNYPLNISGEELMERFVRGDKSRNTEGHGLGLSIAQSLMKLIGGDMNIIVDGDLFKVVLIFDRYVPLENLHDVLFDK